ncbi:MAG: hypothetical protein L0G09_12940 [Acinetobacter sp.]|uniref:hypothetical protein n=1 Tax=Acinetobacter TaxID=469 RepID=UPI0011B073F1|nr:hypothetical protein [Acinetobacter sp. MYb10]MDN5418333.1 hypothetical protein [Acinetobacter sp.]MDN5491249.1 hypothetical protein [Acinetobacter sp.]MDN5623551.1 hypothetical protein [Acinetobacter sp.]MDN5648363.1 hypothetical protein [Acinetobacter sp.]QLD60968.1 hypothetical protein CQZ96_006605 [Acinetobacter sp. MYb10]
MSTDPDDLRISSDVLLGSYQFGPTQIIDVEFDLEVEKPKFHDFVTLLQSAVNVMGKLTQQKLSELQSQIAKELTDAAYIDMEAEIRHQRQQALKAQLCLYKICFFIEGVTSLIFIAQMDYPGLWIYCQINSAYEIEDIEVSEPR